MRIVQEYFWRMKMNKKNTFRDLDEYEIEFASDLKKLSDTYGYSHISRYTGVNRTKLWKIATLRSRPYYSEFKKINVRYKRDLEKLKEIE